MSLTRIAAERVVMALILAAAAASFLWMMGAPDAAFAQPGPFGVPRTASSPPPADGLVGWILAKQAEFSLAMRAMLRNAKSDGSAVWGLFGLAFLYGIFHAAGPGHGKAVISSYVVANEETWRRGVVLSFASALLQAAVAVTIVGVAAAIFNATMATMCKTERYIEIASYALIALIGLRLIWAKGRGFLSAARVLGRPLRAVGAAVTAPHEKHGHDHHHHGDHDHDHEHHHHHGEEHASAWGHAHGPEPSELAGPGGWKRGLAAIVAVGMRPCSGAILVLVFALAQGMLWVGVGATFMMAIGTAITVAVIATLAVAARSVAAQFAGSRSGYGMLALRGIEVGAAIVIFAFGALLLAGYMYAERLPLC